jgi:hypothetical protein
MVFAASACQKHSVVFDGQGDHQGEHLTYQRSAENLLIIGDFIHQGKPVRQEWRMIQMKNWTSLFVPKPPGIAILYHKLNERD